MAVEPTAWVVDASVAFGWPPPQRDCLYVALAEREHATLITADQRLLRKLASLTA